MFKKAILCGTILVLARNAILQNNMEIAIVIDDMIINCCKDYTNI